MDPYSDLAAIGDQHTLERPQLVIVVFHPCQAAERSPVHAFRTD
jgi:hypothetical protein